MKRQKLLGWYILRGFTSIFTLCLLARWLLPMAMTHSIVGSGLICWLIIALTMTVWFGTSFLTRKG